MGKFDRPAELKVVVLETTKRCNLRCIHCAVSEENNQGGYTAEDLPFELFQKVLPLLRKYRPTVQLSGHGETLLHPHFMEMLEAVTDAGCSVMFQTNGTLLNARIVEQIVSHRVSAMVISLDGASPEVFNGIRRRASLEKILANIQLLNEAKRRHDTNEPALGIEFVAMKRNVHELPTVIRMAGELGAVHVQVAELVEFIMTRGETLIGDPQMAYWAGEAEKEARKWGLKLILPPHIPGRDLSKAAETGLVTIEQPVAAAPVDQPAPPPVAEEPAAPAPPPVAEEPAAPAPPPSYQGLRKTCREPWERVFVQHSGDVWPCCVITESYGNLGEKSFEEIWNGPRYQELRASLQSDNPHPTCIRCPFYGWEPADLSDADIQILKVLRQLECPNPDAELKRISSGELTMEQSFLLHLDGASLSNAAFVDRTYRGILGRAPDPNGYRGWLETLDRGRMNRAAMVSSFISSPEFSELLGVQ